MGRKDVTRFIKIEERLDKIEESLEGVRSDHYALSVYYRNDMAKMRDLLTELIEGE